MVEAPSDDVDLLCNEKPMAELFPEATIMFADICGFTAWSSARQPSEVFVLLETVFNAFDAIARSLGVYKVETIGDCYVAVAGVPNACTDHALKMAKFAHLSLMKMSSLVRRLERRLGPDTAELSMRFGK
jgi:class 3 adenylate cyclase